MIRDSLIRIKILFLRICQFFNSQNRNLIYMMLK